MSYDVFISYRRKGSGAGVAGEMQSKLQSRGYKVFLDVDNIGSGAFPEQIDQAIQQCNDFLLILSPGMLDRCKDEEDWVRHEIVLAKKYGKNIIGVSLPGFVMPTAEELPEDLHEIPEKQVFIWSHEYRNASFEKIVENMKTTSVKKKKAKLHYVWIGAAVVLLAVVVWWLLPSGGDDEPVSKPNEPAVDYRQIFTQSVNDTFASFVQSADSLLKLVPANPADKEDFEALMECIGGYSSALAYEKSYPGVVRNTLSVTNRLDSLMGVRESRLKRELEAANKFLEVDQIEFAQYRFENAQILATPEEANKLQDVGKKFPK
ncbi:MAG: toll/interleukin-1 receptor domain-containing protein [Bacteroidales bacterium]|nr:toll/interleukin-1 receptor domain-containing protein [Bacteroidales bacterium]